MAVLAALGVLAVVALVAGLLAEQPATRSSDHGAEP